MLRALKFGAGALHLAKVAAIHTAKVDSVSSSRKGASLTAGRTGMDNGGDNLPARHCSGLGYLVHEDATCSSHESLGRGDWEGRKREGGGAGVVVHEVLTPCETMSQG